MRYLISVAAFMLGAGACLSLAQAADTVNPGLWEVTSKMQSSDSAENKSMEEARKHLQNVPPEQRKMIEEMMAKQGMPLPKMGKDGMVMKICLTPDMVKQRKGLVETRDKCSTKIENAVNGKMKFSTVCSKPPSKTEGEVSLISASQYSVVSNTTSSHQGKSTTHTVNLQGKWLANDCGSVKPVGVMH
ncbi:DUF3617 domain-containing protein [Massilia sp. W12]|uniref:DUF3617 domain-containing protein n=1 Tax=Massilia sp. W12 TaxID=3126507 RepID=UPI0030CCA0B0